MCRGIGDASCSDVSAIDFDSICGNSGARSSKNTLGQNEVLAFRLFSIDAYHVHN